MSRVVSDPRASARGPVLVEAWWVHNLLRRRVRSDLKSECVTRESAIYMAASQSRVGHVSVGSDGHQSVSQSVPYSQHTRRIDFALGRQLLYTTTTRTYAAHLTPLVRRAVLRPSPVSLPGAAEGERE